MTLRFIEFVRLHSQNAAFCLGLIPHPQTGKPETNLALARMLIDQLAAIAHKTKGNLTTDEETTPSPICKRPTWKPNATQPRTRRTKRRTKQHGGKVS